MIFLIFFFCLNISVLLLSPHVCEWFLDEGYRKAFTDLPHLTVSRSAFSSWVLPRVCACFLWAFGLILPFYQDQLQGLLLQHWVQWPGHFAASLVTYRNLKKNPKSLMTNNNKNNPPPAQVLFSLGEANNPHHRKQQQKNLTTIKSAGISIVGTQTKIKRKLYPLLKILLYSKVFQCSLLKVKTLSHTLQLYEDGFLPPFPSILKGTTLAFSFSFFCFFFFLSSLFACSWQISSHIYTYNTWWEDRNTNLRKCATDGAPMFAGTIRR